MSWQLTLIVVLFVGADPRRRVDALPAPVQRRLPRRARAGRHEPVQPAGGHHRRARHPGVRPRGTSRHRRFVETNRALYRSHLHSVKISTWYFGLVEWSRHHVHRADRRCRRLPRAPRRRSRSAPSPRSCCCWPTCSTRCSSCRSCTTRCRAPPPSLHKLYDADRHGARRGRAPAPGGAARRRRARSPTTSRSPTTVPSGRRCTT